MSPLGHLALATVSSGVLYAASGDPAAAAACFLAGVFIDLDHFPEYFWFVGLKLDIADFQRACEEARFPKTLLILHSWELLALGWVAALGFLPGLVPEALLLGLTLHMVGDQLFNDCYPGCYFLSYRLYHRCDAARCFRKAARLRAALTLAKEAA